jgi:tRNA (cmo5U34)-methyltransferase
MSSIEAYDDRKRIKKYDVDMDVMHPNRGKMAAVALDFLAALNGAPSQVLDLGCGTGFVAEHLLGRFAQVQINCLDGAQNILDLAAMRLKDHADRLTYTCSDFRALNALSLKERSFDVVMSSYALHHLSADEKVQVLRDALGLLKPGGLFMNADLIKNPSTAFENSIQDLRVQGILQRASVGDERFASKEVTHAYLAAMERAEGDQPLDIEEDLALFRRAGYCPVSVLWLEYREAVICAQRPGL